MVVLRSRGESRCGGHCSSSRWVVVVVVVVVVMIVVVVVVVSLWWWPCGGGSCSSEVMVVVLVVVVMVGRQRVRARQIISRRAVTCWCTHHTVRWGWPPSCRRRLALPQSTRPPCQQHSTYAPTHGNAPAAALPMPSGCGRPSPMARVSQRQLAGGWVIRGAGCGGNCVIVVVVIVVVIVWWW